MYTLYNKTTASLAQRWAAAQEEKARTYAANKEARQTCCDIHQEAVKMAQQVVGDRPAPETRVAWLAELLLAGKVVALTATGRRLPVVVSHD